MGNASQTKTIEIIDAGIGRDEVRIQNQGTASEISAKTYLYDFCKSTTDGKQVTRSNSEEDIRKILGPSPEESFDQFLQLLREIETGLSARMWERIIPAIGIALKIIFQGKLI